MQWLIGKSPIAAVLREALRVATPVLVVGVLGASQAVDLCRGVLGLGPSGL